MGLKVRRGQTSPFNIFPIKGRYMWRDVERFASTYGLPLRRPATFPQFALILLARHFRPRGH